MFCHIFFMCYTELIQNKLIQFIQIVHGGDRSEVFLGKRINSIIITWLNSII